MNCSCGTNSSSEDYRSPSSLSSRQKLILNGISVDSDLETSLIVQEGQDQTQLQQALQHHQQSQVINNMQKVEDINQQPENNLESNACHSTTLSDQRQFHDRRKCVVKVITIGLIATLIFIQKRK